MRAVKAQLVHSIELVRNLAYLSTLASEKGTIAVAEKATDVVLPQTIIEAALFFQEVGAQRGVEIHLSDRDTQYQIKGHQHLLRQVFMNLFDNGTKYSEANSHIVVDVHPQKSTNDLIIEVKSRGLGFDFDEREKLFEAGYRGRHAGSVRASGTGLGLYVCRRILEDAHGAMIEAEHSSSTRTTCFRLRFKAFTIARASWRQKF
jgi:signal transduction histidine kinase